MIPVIYINTKRNPFVTQIMLMLKQYETRTRNTLKSLMEWSLGERILIAETGHGDPVVRCSAVIDHIISVHTEDEWNKYRSATCIPVGSEYDWKPDTKVKWLYHLSDIRPVCSFVLPKSCRRHGRVWAEYEGCYFDKYFHSNEMDTVISIDRIRSEFLDLQAEGYYTDETFEYYLEGCMAWNNGDLTPLGDYINRMNRRKNELLRYADINPANREDYDSEIADITAMITELQQYREE